MNKQAKSAKLELSGSRDFWIKGSREVIMDFWIEGLRDLWKK